MRMLHPVPMDYVGLIPIALAILLCQNAKSIAKIKNIGFQM